MDWGRSIHVPALFQIRTVACSDPLLVLLPCSQRLQSKSLHEGPLSLETVLTAVELSKSEWSDSSQDLHNIRIDRAPQSKDFQKEAPTGEAGGLGVQLFPFCTGLFL